MFENNHLIQICKIIEDDMEISLGEEMFSLVLVSPVLLLSMAGTIALWMHLMRFILSSGKLL